MMLMVPGTVVKGYQAASGKRRNWSGLGTIALQMNFLRERGYAFADKLARCTQATVNVATVDELHIGYWEHLFDGVAWLSESETWYEQIAFNPIVFSVDGKEVVSWLYQASKSPHRNNPMLFEVIAPYIEGLNYSDRCLICIEEKYAR